MPRTIEKIKPTWLTHIISFLQFFRKQKDLPKIKITNNKINILYVENVLFSKESVSEISKTLTNLISF
jgi:hypothetical protein